MTKRLYRSANDRKICGICAGIGEYLDVDPTIIRLVWILFTVFSAGIGGVLAYFLACLVIPEQ
ncbi:PspC domain-containing protein [Acidilutibacter cellobiosedens]|uniref:PspC domain-containing protein n=1 Tax=Acidilutibacter cellobiosedens TaxID=2507161 RepID=A0A410QAA7_9FIRM|nr:PspC domain-containing protein [Acidilutibacter cellobiosedens]QAT60923.1 PspC domain-containing protein [Acidilutibacter cellobiosedens]